MSYPLSPSDAQMWYDTSRKWFALFSAIVFPITFVINAPFGRFASKTNSFLSVDGIKSWIFMEIISPLSFLYAYATSPLTPLSSSTTPNIPNPASSINPPTSRPIPVPPPHAYAGLWTLFGLPTLQLATDRTNILISMYLVHYLNRAIISPLRTPSRSKSNIIVPLVAVTFNVINGSLLGSYLASPEASVSINSRPSGTFYLGLAMWAVGFIGNIAHDEILFNIRRKAKKSQKKENGEGSGEHYAIPSGLLFEYVSFPNYTCEWLEWFGFALATSPFPVTSFSNLSFASIKSAIKNPASQFAPKLTPPWLFLLTEVLVMFPRAYKGHKWYKNKFGNAYPKKRAIVIPGFL